MRKAGIFILMLVLVFSAIFVAAPEDKNKKEEVPVGMERLEIRKGLEIIVPEGTKMRKQANIFMLEGVNEYVARKFHELRKRIGKLEFSVEELKKEIKQLKENQAKAQKPESPPQEAKQ